MAKRSKPKSHNAGRRGVNWVRAFFDRRDGAWYVEWREKEIHPETGVVRMRRPSEKLIGVTSLEEAAARADSLAAEFLKIPNQPAPQLSIVQLLRRYQKERTPQKGRTRRDHDGRAARIWTAFFAGQAEPERRGARHPMTLDRVDWDRFIAGRRAGTVLEGLGAVRNSAIRQDLKYLVAVLNWGTGVVEDGVPLLARSPWSAEVRRAQQWPMPRERTPERPAMTAQLRKGLIAHAPNAQFGVALLLEMETRRRNEAIRQLTWSDVDLEGASVRWRSETDKAGRERVTPLSRAAVAALRSLPRGIGQAPVFPSARDAARATPRDTFQTWLARAKERWLRSIEDEAAREQLRAELRRVGFHSEKRAGVRSPEFRRLDPKLQEELSGTNWETLRNIYDDITMDDMREAVERMEKAL